MVTDADGIVNCASAKSQMQAILDQLWQDEMSLQVQPCIARDKLTICTALELPCQCKATVDQMLPRC